MWFIIINASPKNIMQKGKLYVSCILMRPIAFLSGSTNINYLLILKRISFQRHKAVKRNILSVPFTNIVDTNSLIEKHNYASRSEFCLG